MVVAPLLLSASCALVTTAPHALAPRCGRAPVVAMSELPRNLKEMVASLKEAMQLSLTGRRSRLAVEMPLGFEFGVEGEKAKRKGQTKVLTSDDVMRSEHWERIHQRSDALRERDRYVGGVRRDPAVDGDHSRQYQ